MSIAWNIYQSPLGPLTLTGGPAGLSQLSFPGKGVALDEARRDPHAFTDAVIQLDEYFAGRRQRFDLALDLTGTPFQLAVWQALTEIPYGTTVSYSDVARTIGRAERVRAVGAANGRNPIAVIVPCHRVIGADGSLTGYGGGLHRKRALLDLEATGAGGQPSASGHRQLMLM